MQYWWNDNRQEETEALGEETVLVRHCSPKISYWLSWNSIRVSAVRCQGLIAQIHGIGPIYTAIKEYVPVLKDICRKGTKHLGITSKIMPCPQYITIVK
jgi:hypothetical protein